MAQSLGEILKQARREQKLTQTTVAEGICSQAMLSAIENNRYTPNAELLIALCQRLSIELGRLSLAQNYAIGSSATYNSEIEKLCNQHRYPELLAFLKRREVLAAIQSAAQTQAYYYYLGVATYQTTTPSDLVQVTQYLQLSLASATAATPVLTHLTEVTLAFVFARHQLSKQALDFLDRALKDSDSLPFEPNVTVIYYLAALTRFELKHDLKSMAAAAQGLDTAAKNDSHYLLANLYYLLAVLAQRNEKHAEEETAAQRAQIFAELFHEQIYRP